LEFARVVGAEGLPRGRARGLDLVGRLRENRRGDRQRSGQRERVPSKTVQAIEHQNLMLSFLAAGFAVAADVLEGAGGLELPPPVFAAGASGFGIGPETTGAADLAAAGGFAASGADEAAAGVLVSAGGVASGLEVSAGGSGAALAVAVALGSAVAGLGAAF